MLELFKEAWECGYNNNNIEKMVKVTSGLSILIRQHYALIYNFDVRFVEIFLFFSDFFKKTFLNKSKFHGVYLQTSTSLALRGNSKGHCPAH